MNLCLSIDGETQRMTARDSDADRASKQMRYGWRKTTDSVIINNNNRTQLFIIRASQRAETSTNTCDTRTHLTETI